MFETKPKYEKWLTPAGLIGLEKMAYSCGGITALQIKLGIGKSTMERWRGNIKIDEAIEKGLARANKKEKPLAVIQEKPEIVEDMLAWIGLEGVEA